MGIVTTGRTEVYVGVYVRILTPDGKELVVEHDQDPVAALREVSLQLTSEGWDLKATGLDEAFSQSPMSFGTPWGYHPDFDGPVHMLQPPSGQIITATPA